MTGNPIDLFIELCPKEHRGWLRKLYATEREYMEEILTAEEFYMTTINDKQAREVAALTRQARERYYVLREGGESHNLSMILASREGPAGRVPGTEHPCPKRGK